ncbi:MAG TPA: CinA family protein [Acetobacteraceae bacterium]|nr:CinA family protein [Acetobacteraceae bacterium]
MAGEKIADLARRVVAAAIAHNFIMATAESCTGGLIAAALTEIAGVSAIFHSGFVTYSNAAKTELLGVPEALLETHGAVSEPVARAMAEGALIRAEAHLAIAVTGIAGPGGGSAGKPVGTVWFGLARRGGETIAVRHQFQGDRRAVRMAAAETALILLNDALLH